MRVVPGLCCGRTRLCLATSLTHPFFVGLHSHRVFLASAWSCKHSPRPLEDLPDPRSPKTATRAHTATPQRLTTVLRQLKKLQCERLVLLTNMSSLFKTAQREIKARSNELQEARREIFALRAAGGGGGGAGAGKGRPQQHSANPPQPAAKGLAGSAGRDGSTGGGIGGGGGAGKGRPQQPSANLLPLAVKGLVASVGRADGSTGGGSGGGGGSCIPASQQGPGTARQRPPAASRPPPSTHERRHDDAGPRQDTSSGGHQREKDRRSPSGPAGDRRQQELQTRDRVSQEHERSGQQEGRRREEQDPERGSQQRQPTGQEQRGERGGVKDDRKGSSGVGRDGNRDPFLQDRSNWRNEGQRGERQAAGQAAASYGRKRSRSPRMRDRSPKRR